MPGFDRTGPTGQGPVTGRGRGIGLGNVFIHGVSARTSLRSGNRGVGGVSQCVCPNCGTFQPHVRGILCTQVKCEKCGTPLRGDYCMPETK